MNHTDDQLIDNFFVFVFFLSYKLVQNNNKRAILDSKQPSPYDYFMNPFATMEHAWMTEFTQTDLALDLSDMYSSMELLYNYPVMVNKEQKTFRDKE